MKVRWQVRWRTMWHKVTWLEKVRGNKKIKWGQNRIVISQAPGWCHKSVPPRYLSSQCHPCQAWHLATSPYLGLHLVGHALVDFGFIHSFIICFLVSSFVLDLSPLLLAFSSMPLPLDPNLCCSLQLCACCHSTYHPFPPSSYSLDTFFTYDATQLVTSRIFIFCLYPLTACSIHCWTHRIYTLSPSFAKCRQLWPLSFPLLSLVYAGQLWPHPHLSYSSHDSLSTNSPCFQPSLKNTCWQQRW